MVYLPSRNGDHFLAQGVGGGINTVLPLVPNRHEVSFLSF